MANVGTRCYAPAGRRLPTVRGQAPGRGRAPALRAGGSAVWGAVALGPARGGGRRGTRTLVLERHTRAIGTPCDKRCAFDGTLEEVTPEHAQTLTPDTIVPCGRPGCEVPASAVAKATGCSLGTTAALAAARRHRLGALRSSQVVRHDVSSKVPVAVTNPCMQKPRIREYAA